MDLLNEIGPDLLLLGCGKILVVEGQLNAGFEGFIESSHSI